MLQVAPRPRSMSTLRRIIPPKNSRSGRMSIPNETGIHDAQRGAQVPPEEVGPQSTAERASSGTWRLAWPSHPPQRTCSGAGVRTRCSSVRPHSLQLYSKSGMLTVYTHLGYMEPNSQAPSARACAQVNPRARLKLS
jgi:hypothetical protein